jgi:N-acetylglucosamine-6-phosphate deacetylase
VDVRGVSVVERLRGGLVVSCQAPPEDPLSGPEVMARVARAASLAGAAAVRVEGPEDIRAVRSAVSLPVIGLWKEGSEGVYITPTLEHARAVAHAGADIVAVDGTARPRPDGLSLGETIHRIHEELGCPVLADVSTLEEGLAAAEAGADAVATTLSGYTPYTEPLEGPDLDLVSLLAARLDVPVVAEGRYGSPEEARAALARGAWAVVVGTAITRPMLAAARFVEAVSLPRRRIEVGWALVGEALLPEGVCRAAVVVEDGKVSDVLRDPRPEELPTESRHVHGLISPGFMDLQVNGAFGHDVGVEAEAIAAISRELTKTGVTAFLPTAVSWQPERYGAFFEALSAAMPGEGARILGAHVEGPFFAPERRGAHDPRNIRPVDFGLLREMLGSGLVRILTLAPELPGAREAIELLLADGVVPSAGHTDASYEEILTAAEAGLPMATHLYNAMSAFRHREPGAVGGVLADDRIRAGIIADGIHVHEGALRVAYRQKGPERLFLVTDAMAAAGMALGEYDLSGRRVRLEDGAVRLPDGTLAGSSLTMDAAVRNTRALMGASLEDAVRMATATPATALGFSKKGRIAPGADADLVVISEEDTVEETIVAGKTVYRRE